MSEVKTVIRIEHPFDGNGLWRSKLKTVTRITLHTQFNKISSRHGDSIKFPSYQSDYWLKEQINVDTVELFYHFAFKDLAQLNTALTSDELKECINTLGFRVLMLDVTEYYESPFQVIFRKDSIQTTKDISHLFL